ncbi:type III secretion system translocon subunit SctE [Acidovorax sp.]|uniref:type III secretion system translocon subunit SctE n=1 Tax=Acidovorax sp. TaxID=1872122 RepID=UPI00391F6254
MNDITRVSTTPAFVNQQLGDMNADILAKLQASIQTDPNKILDEISKLAGTLQATGQSAGGNNVANAYGAPQIDGVSLNFSAEDMAAALLVLQGKTQEAQLKTAKEGIDTASKNQQLQHEKSMKKIQDWIKKCEDQAAKEKAGGVLNWFKKIFTAIAAAFAVVAAAVATAATGGAAAPLLALAVLALASSVVSIASEIDKARGGKGFDTVAEWMDPAMAFGKGIGALAKELGANEEQVGIVTATFAVVATIAIMAVSIVLTGGASAVSDAQKIALAVGRAGQAIAGVASGATQAAQGAVNVAIAHDKRDAEVIQADKKKIDAIIAKLQQQMEENREELKKVMDEMMEGMNIVTQMINAAGQSRAQISSNLTGKSQTI